VNDEFYTRTDLVWDFYRALRAWHERLFNDTDYGVMLSGFALGLTANAGSRQRRRTRGSASPRDLRAISHNAVLQQLAILVNSAAGIGSALQRERDRLGTLIASSPRMRHLITLAIRARVRTSLPVLRAYARLYDPAVWVLLARQSDGSAAAAYRAVYYALRDDETAYSLGRMANLVSTDLARFDRLLSRVPDAPSIAERHEERLDTHILHALRQALMMRAFVLTARLPRISERHDLNQRDLLRMVMDMRLREAIELIVQIFPRLETTPQAYRELVESGSGGAAMDYSRIHRDVVRPLEDIHRDLHGISLALTHTHDAYG
jgi:phosphoenolpyruvate carboxylase